MKVSRRRVLRLVLAAVPGLVCAQWPDRPSAKTPRGADGKPKLDAPTPRTADGKPDLSGVWDYAGRIGLPRDFIPGVPNEPPPEVSKDGIPAATFFDIGAGIKGGLPFTPWASELLKQRKAENSKDNPDAHCLPMGLMQFHMHPQPRKVIQTRDVIAILYEGNSGVRQIFIDGRPLPDEDAVPWWYGYSTGHWDGDTLVIETTRFRDGGWLDIYGSPLTDQAKMIERWRRLNFGSIQIDITIDDPKAYTKPFSVRVHHRIALDGPKLDAELIEFICDENNKAPQLMVGK